MALGDFTKQIAQQALGNQMKDALGIAEPARTQTGPAAPENVCATIAGQIQAMQKALKEDDELVVLCPSGGENVRVLEVFVPSPSVLVLSGIGADKAVTRIVAHVESLQLVCKIVKVQPPARPARVAVIFPKPKPE